MFHTGGTTGAPKQAGHTHANEVADAWMLAANSLFDADSAVFAALPLFHVNALVVTLLAPLFKGQPVVWAGPLGYREPALFGQFWKIVEHYRIAAMSAVPTVYATLARVPVDADISSLRVAMVGASPLPAAVRDAFHANTGVRLLEGYGLTEGTCASARSFPDAQRPGSVGQRLPYQRVRIVRVTRTGSGRTCRPAEVGLLVIGGPTVFPGYLTGRDGDRHVLDGLGKLVDGWLDTGDLARPDQDGFIYLTGRAKDLIIRGGHNIDPAIVEDALLAHPQVTAASAVGRPDVHAGEVPVAYVTLAPAATVTGDELREFAADRVAERAAAPKQSPCWTRCRSPPSASRTSSRCAPTPPAGPSPTPSPGSPAHRSTPRSRTAPSSRPSPSPPTPTPRGRRRPRPVRAPLAAHRAVHRPRSRLRLTVRRTA